MGRIDTETKAFMSNPSRFADAFNYLIYDGEPVIRPEDLRPLDTTEIAIPYGNDARAPEQKYRDVLKLVSIMRDDEAIYAVLGVENQTAVHYAMPVKDMLYDALNYARQVTEAKKSFRSPLKISDDEFLSGFRKEDKLLPVITLVIYFGDSAWDGPMTLHDMLSAKNQRLLRFVPDYRINLIAPGMVPEEDLQKFTTDLRELLQFVRSSGDEAALARLLRDNDRFTRMNPDTAELINLLTDSKLTLNTKEGTVNMCKAIQQMREHSKAAGMAEGMAAGMAEGKAVGMAEGKAVGMAEGIHEGRVKAYAEMVADGTIAMQFAARKLNLTVEEFVKKAGIKPGMN